MLIRVPHLGLPNSKELGWGSFSKLFGTIPLRSLELPSDDRKTSEPTQHRYSFGDLSLASSTVQRSFICTPSSNPETRTTTLS